MREYIPLRELLVRLEFAGSSVAAEKLIAERRVKLCGTVATNGDMTVASDETDIILGPKQTLASTAVTPVAPAQVVATREARTEPLVSATVAGEQKPSITPAPASSSSSLRLKPQPHQPVVGVKENAIKKPERPVHIPKKPLQSRVEAEFGDVIKNQASATAFIKGGLILVNGTAWLAPLYQTTDNEKIEMVQNAPLLQWFACLRNCSQTEAIGLIQAGRVYLERTLILDPTFIVSSKLVSKISILSLGTARLLLGEKRPLKSAASSPPTPLAPMTIADTLLQKGLCENYAHAEWLCMHKRVQLGGEVVDSVGVSITDPSLALTILPAGDSTDMSAKQKLMKSYINKLKEELLNRKGRSWAPFEMPSENGLSKLETVIAICEYGTEAGIAWDSRLGIFYKLPHRDVDINGTNETQPISEEETQFTLAAPKVAHNEHAPTSLEPATLKPDVKDEQKNTTIKAVNSEVKMELETIANNKVALKVIDALITQKLALDEEDALLLCSSRAVIVADRNETDINAIITEPDALRLDSDVATMRRLVARATKPALDAALWPSPAQHDVLWALIAISCFVCNITIEACAVGKSCVLTEILPIFLDGGIIYASSSASSAMLKGASRVILERACSEGLQRWNDATLQSPYKRMTQTEGKCIVGPSSEYFWPLLGLYSHEQTCREFLHTFFEGKDKQEDTLRLILDFVEVVTDDSFLLAKSNRLHTATFHKIRLHQLSESEDLAGSAWPVAFQSLLA